MNLCSAFLKNNLLFLFSPPLSPLHVPELFWYAHTMSSVMASPGYEK